MKISEIIINDIVEDIVIYKDIYEEYINFIRSEIKKDYNPDFSFDEFCSMLINNFDGVNDDINMHLNSSDKSLIDKMFDSIMKISLNAFKDDEESYKKLRKIYTPK